MPGAKPTAKSDAAAPEANAAAKPQPLQLKDLRRCAKCARRCAPSEFETKSNPEGFTPYCTECRLRCPNLAAAPTRQIVTSPLTRPRGR